MFFKRPEIASVLGTDFATLPNMGKGMANQMDRPGGWGALNPPIRPGVPVDALAIYPKSRQDERGGREKLSDFADRSNASATAIMIIAIDNLGDFNRMFGHDASDEVVYEVCRRIAGAAPRKSMIQIVSGSKLGIVTECTGESEARDLAETLSSAVSSEMVTTSAGPIGVTISAGATMISLSGGDPISAAQEALDLARLRGPASFHFFADGGALRTDRDKSRNLVTDVMDALNDDRIVLAYQPVINAVTRKPAFHECLARLVEKSGKVLPAGAFMPAIEARGCVTMVDRQVLRLTFETLAKAPNIRLSLNVSPRTMLDTTWMRTFEELAEKTPYAAERIIVEITESTAIMDDNRAMCFMERLRGHQCALALDDFGAGYTSFRHLRQLRADIVKIDGSFVRGLAEDKDNRLFVRTLSEIARNFDMLSVAEFVETEAEADILQELGVDRLQGYYFGKPDLAPEWIPAETESAQTG